jgi:hypothetical protein
MIRTIAKTIGYWLFLPFLILGAAFVNRKWAREFINPELLDVDAEIYQ